MHNVREWSEQRTYDYAQFVDPVALAGRKRELGLSVSVLLTCLRATKAVRTSIGDIYALNERAPVTDQIALITASSTHGLDAACPGVEVHCGGELMPEYGPVIGKGDAMWKALSIARGDLVVYVDVEAPVYEPHFVCGVLGPLLSFPRVRFAKAAYEYPSGGAQDESKPEVNEALAKLKTRALINLHYHGPGQLRHALGA